MAFIEFFTKKGLKEAYSKKDNVELDGRKLKLSLSVPEETINDPDFENESDDDHAVKSIFDTSIPRRYKKINRKRKSLKSKFFLRGCQKRWPLCKARSLKKSLDVWTKYNSFIMRRLTFVLEVQSV